jgi:hypothetical protein
MCDATDVEHKLWAENSLRRLKHLNGQTGDQLAAFIRLPSESPNLGGGLI